MKKRPALLLVLLAVVSATFGASPEEKLTELKLTLPAAIAPVANYVPAVRSGALVFLAGHVPRDGTGKVVTGKVGRDATEAQAVEAARTATLALLATLKREVGDLARVKRIVRVGGFVNSSEDFTAQSAVMNGCSDLLVALFGDRGRHARTALGVVALPLNAMVEIELVVEVE
jgi:enamine deaminase RidA (YjgF/YER057c/UK114 family)